MRLIVKLLLSFYLAFSFVAAAQSAESSKPGTSVQRARFEYHSAFLMNLHHFLLDVAIRKKPLQELPWDHAPSEAELTVLKEAVDFYQADYAKRDVMFDATMQGIKRGLSVDDQRRDATGLPIPAPLIAVLNRVAPVYARCIWASQDKSNQDWISQTRQLDAKYGADIQAGIEKYMAHAFPARPIRMDAVVLTGTRQGAYTDEQIVIPSGRPDYQSLAALEMLYHEASHTTVTDAIVTAINNRMKATHHQGESDLWHVLQFFTVGKVTQDVLKQSGNLEYQPYALKNGLYQKAWPEYLGVIDQVWIPYMDGELNFRQAIEQAVDQMPVEKK
ncbi:hypothetical protein [Undibacterium sp. TS12]|uniref:hypothetical protein n=1 Tax=Undibacterium sp. TS12 TaxID=2908202 RepID=UPI001F4D00CC|nr:hypothetical protein [Undibacterium sp. TS12]MCH8622464.1 hypothetical protein [Undibacterium sp. TS12]